MAFNFPKPQKLRQNLERECSIPVFAELSGVSEDEVRQDFPQAVLGLVTVEQWISWLHKRGFRVLRRDGCPADVLPCVHLVATHQPRDGSDFHWIYRDADGDVHDPSPVFAAMPADHPSMRNLSVYFQQVLTISIASSALRRDGPC